MIDCSSRSTPQRYTPKKIDVRMTTTVVAYTSLRLGQVTRPVSLRTSERNRRERPHQPVMLSRARSPRDSFASCSAIAAFIAKVWVLPLAPRCSIWQDRRESNPQPPVLETGALPIELLSFLNRGASPLGLPYTLSREPLRRLAPFAWARFAALARVLLASSGRPSGSVRVGSLRCARSRPARPPSRFYRRVARFARSLPASSTI